MNAGDGNQLTAIPTVTVESRTQFTAHWTPQPINTGNVKDTTMLQPFREIGGWP